MSEKTRLVLSLLVILLAECTNAQPLPPSRAWELRTNQSGGRYHEAIWNHSHWLKYADVPDADKTALLGLNLLYAEEEIPGFSSFPSDLNGLHTWVSVGKVSGFRRTYSAAETRHLQIGELEKFTPVRQLDIAIEIFPSADSARVSLDAIYRSQLLNYQTRIVSLSESDSLPTLNRGLPSGNQLGSAFVVCPAYSPAPTIAFQVGRALVRIQNTGEADLQFAEAIAWGILYRLQHHPELVGGVTPPFRLDGTVDLNGVKVGALTVLRDASCQVKEDREVRPWSREVRILLSKSPLPVVAKGTICTRWTARVIWGQRWVELEAFSWEMKTWDGKVVKLSRPVFPYRGELIAPLQEVRQALGLTVQAQ